MGCLLKHLYSTKKTKNEKLSGYELDLDTLINRWNGLKLFMVLDILRIFVCAFNFNMYVKMHISRGKESDKKSSCLKWTCRLSCNYHRVATLSKFYLTDAVIR